MMDSVFDKFNEGKKRLMIIAPTGLGKSAVMGGIADYFNKKREDNITLVLSHLSLLISQSGGSFQKFWDLDTDVLQATRTPNPNSRCILSTVQSSSILEKVFTWKTSLPKGREVGLILLDEVHINSGVNRVDKIIDRYFPNARVVGFTGSPFKDNKDMSNLFEEVAYSVSLQEAIAMNILVPPIMHTMQIDRKDLEDVMAKVISTIKVSHSTEKCCVFMKTIKEAELMRDMIRDAGFTCEAITSKVTGEARDSILESVRDNKPDSPQILTTVDVLSVGFDAPALRAIIMPYGTGSVSTYLQRIGRGLRTWDEGGKEHCDIYIGGIDPQVEKGKWEKIQKKALTAGGSDGEAEIPDEVGDDSTTTLTLETVTMARALRKKNMTELASMIENREFPNDLLGHLVAAPTVANFNPKTPATRGQLDYLTKKNIDTSKSMTKNEAATIITGIAKSEGWHKPRAAVPTGKYKGYQVDQVPFSYINLVTKRNGKYYNSELARAFGRE